jgi:transposase
MAPIELHFERKEKYKYSTPRRRNRIIAHAIDGVKIPRIAELANCSVEHVRGVKKRWRHQDGGKSKPGRGRKPLLTERDKRAVMRIINRNPFIQMASLLRESGLECTGTCLTNFLKKAGVKHGVAAQRPFLTEDDARRRFRWSSEYKDKALAFWRRVAFSDECTVERGQGQRRVWAWRPGSKLPLLLPPGQSL